jgi:diaminopimelate epimerase
VKLQFSKYQATGNDFVLIDNRSGQLSFSKEQIVKLCHRKFGIGADGIMLIEKHPELDFNLVYYNSDGSQSLCGNGCRAAVHMAASLGMVSGRTKFNAFDGIHEAELYPDDIVKLKMNDVAGVKQHGEDLFMNTGSPHYIRFISAIEDYPVFEEGRKVRNDDNFKPGGTNANFVEVLADNAIFVRTYERGVENETLSCGTGVVAAALASSLRGYTSPVKIGTLGGQLTVQFKNGHSAPSEPSKAAPSGQPGTFSDIFLIGPAKLVYQGTMEL